MAAPPPPSRGGMSLYANLLAPKADATASISRAPVAFNNNNETDEARADAATKKPVDPALRFQPIRRPQVKQPKSKTGFSKTFPAAGAGAGAAAAANPPAHAATAAVALAQQPKSTLADWAATEEDEYLYGTGEKRQRGGRRKKKKKVGNEPIETDWDELYDPARPTNVEEYLRSDERIKEVRDWKAVLYAHRRRRRPSYDSEMASDEEDRRPALSSQFAPPASYSFAPPPASPPREPASSIPPDATGDDAYARRLALSHAAPPPTASPPAPEPAPAAPDVYSSEPQPPPSPPAATISGATISRAPVRYEAPAPPPPQSAPEPAISDAMAIDSDGDADRVPRSGSGSDDGDDGHAAPRAKRPGQAGFAERLMSKYGWTRGTGLGADADGITSALRVQVEKRRRRPDAEGGGFAEPGGRGRIVGGGSSGDKKKKKTDGEDGGEDGFGRMSEVVVLRGMLEGMPDLVAEMEAGLAQEIGEECGERYGRVERLFIDVEDRQVFIKFTDQVSALRAVNALEGRIFNGNTIVPRFYDTDKFEQGIYK